jgi:lipopolysaccharide biosynthesis glycosyltransferase
MKNILICTDSNQFKITTVLIKSIIESSYDRDDIFFHIIIPGSDNDTDFLLSISSVTSNYNHYYVDSSLSMGLKLSSNIPISTYHRLLWTEILPPNIENLLYIDTDTLVLRDLSELFAIDFENRLIAAVDTGMKEIHSIKLFESPKRYANAGIILFKLPESRQLLSSINLLDLYNKHSERIVYDDQDLINLIFEDQIKFISNKFNFTVNSLTNMTQVVKKAKNGNLNRNEITIVHFKGNQKPWIFSTILPYKSRWLKLYHQLFNSKPWVSDHSIKEYLTKIIYFIVPNKKLIWKVYLFFR